MESGELVCGFSAEGVRVSGVTLAVVVVDWVEVLCGFAVHCATASPAPNNTTEAELSIFNVI